MGQEIDKRYLELAEKWLNGTITPEEEVVFANWYNQNQDNTVWVESDYAANEVVLRERIRKRLQARNKSVRIGQEKWKPYAYPLAASIVLLLAVAVYFGTSHYFEKGETTDILPGGNHAVLTLGNGKKISLDEVKNQHLITASGINLTNTDEGTLVYTSTALAAPDQSTEKNQIATPNGGKYRILLSDGSTVWLNASSSISFPVVFSDTAREVELEGEAYFEIQADKHRPFRVVTAKHTVNVLGTSFNICAYPDDAATKTTLINGAVQVATAQTHTLLQPGQQAASFLADARLQVSEVDVEAAMAWKMGFFTFDNESLAEVMKKVSRWYDVEVVNQSKSNDFRFGGTFSCNKKLSELLRHLEEISNYHFTLKERRIIVQ
ncbi:DUF4974 domain-containing protein [Olivibacter ginsenosidimutans]|uniref:DUF4974 domain-containing protein n=1 Tax=Olivibacter ginsenosidimutans TaxID=1176537 RepID=A0ABP9BPH9_9SPHI